MSAFLLALLLAGQAEASQLDCEEARTQMDLNSCAAIDFEKADAELNAQYRATMAKVKAGDGPVVGDERPGGEALLRQSQRDWVRFRDAHCTVYGYQARGGSMESMLYNGCRAKLTRQQTENLKDLVIEE